MEYVNPYGNATDEIKLMGLLIEEDEEDDEEYSAEDDLDNPFRGLYLDDEEDLDADPYW